MHGIPKSKVRWEAKIQETRKTAKGKMEEKAKAVAKAWLTSSATDAGCMDTMFATAPRDKSRRSRRMIGTKLSKLSIKVMSH